MYVPHPRIRRLSKIPLAGMAALAALIATSVVCFTAAPNVAQAADTPEITDMTEQDYSDLGLGTSEDIPADTVGPYSTTTPTMAMEVCGAPQSSGKTSTASIRVATSTSTAIKAAATGRT